MNNRLDATFKKLKAEKRAALVTFVTATYPDQKTSMALIKELPAAGADILEIGMPFTDPSADGPAIDNAAQHALKAGASMEKTFEIVENFRSTNTTTPIVLMGYFNPIHAYGLERFVTDAATFGVDGLIIVDLPPEEDKTLRLAANAAGIHFVRLATPTSLGERLQTIIKDASGFIYYVAVAGITGGKSATQNDIQNAIETIKKHTDIPVVVGFGIKNSTHAEAIANHADGAVVGTAIIDIIAQNLDKNGHAKPNLVNQTLDFVRDLAKGVALAKK